MASRCWVGFWTALIILGAVATDLSAMVSFITKFTEESFATMISIIFIVQAIEEMIHFAQQYPITTNTKVMLNDPCICNISNNSTSSSPASSLFGTFSNYSADECQLVGGQASGLQCNFYPYVFMFCVILFITTFFIAYGLQKLRNTTYFPSKVRYVIADFYVIIAIVCTTLINYFVGLNVPKLDVPGKLKPTSGRPWLVNPMDIEYWWIMMLAILPAILFSILILLDQQITTVIVNRKEKKIKKSFGYHLDLLVISFLMIICSILGIPYYVVDTVVSIMHVEALKINQEGVAPGDKPAFLGIREQRMTALLAHLLVGASVFLTPVIRIIPLPVLYGIFLYMGIMALSRQEFAQRVALLLQPIKYQPDLRFLRRIPLKRVHLFTFCQIVCLVILFVIENFKQTAMLFPLMLVVIVIVRKLLEKIFTHEELMCFDDELPKFKDVIRVDGSMDSSRRNSPHLQLSKHPKQQPSTFEKLFFWRKTKKLPNPADIGKSSIRQKCNNSNNDMFVDDSKERAPLAEFNLSDDV